MLEQERRPKTTMNKNSIKMILKKQKESNTIELGVVHERLYKARDINSKNFREPDFD